jgi:hypothetical protein
MLIAHSLARDKHLYFVPRGCALFRSGFRFAKLLAGLQRVKACLDFELVQSLAVSVVALHTGSFMIISQILLASRRYTLHTSVRVSLCSYVVEQHGDEGFAFPNNVR